LAAASPVRMLDYLAGQASDRKLRLFACACCRRIWPLLRHTTTREAVEATERYADGGIAVGEWEGVRAADYESMLAHAWAGDDFAHRAAVSAASANAWEAAAMAAEGITLAVMADKASAAEEAAAQAHLLRCLFGNPFCPSPPLSAAVLSRNDRTIPRLAQAIYDERRMPEGTLDTGRLAILADALLDAGCDNEGLLAHLRSEGPHVRGCWALDLILGKS
jgi:hypothetical protein